MNALAKLSKVQANDKYGLKLQVRVALGNK